MTERLTAPIRWVAGVFRKPAEPTSPAQLKDAIGKALVDHHRRLVVLIDDLDRLEADALLEMFKLVKLTAAFTNTVYVVAYDPTPVSETLELTRQVVSGKDYLEKIVQVSFEVPLPDPADLLKLLLEQVQKIVERVPDAEWENLRWEEFLYDGLRPLVRTPRSVVRFSNSAGLNIRVMPGELNAVDQLALEAIRIFAPRTYRFLRENKELVLGPGPTNAGVAAREDREAVKAEFDEVWDSDGEAVSPYARSICRFLFPQIARLEISGTTQHDLEAFASRKQISSPEYYGRYFFLRVPDGAVSEAEFNSIVAVGSDDDVASRLQSLINDRRIGAFLERLEVAAGDFEPSRIEPLVVALFSVADQLPMESEEFFGFGQQFQLARVMLRLLRVLPSSKERDRIVHRAIEATQALGAVVYQVSMFGKGDGFDEQSLAALRDQALALIREAVVRDDLHMFRNLGNTLFSWREWAGDEEPREYVAHLIETDKGLIAFLEGMASEVKTTVRRGFRTRTDVRHSSVAILTTVEPLLDRTRKILGDEAIDLSAREREVLEAFISHRGDDGVDDFLRDNGPETQPAGDPETE